MYQAEVIFKISERRRSESFEEETLAVLRRPRLVLRDHP